MVEHSFTEIAVSPPGGTPATLRSVGELEAWAGAEKQFWHRVRPESNEVTSQTSAPANQMFDLVAAYRSQPTDARFDQIKAFLQTYDKGKAVHSSSPTGRFIAQLLDSEPDGPLQARAALLHLFSARGQHVANTVPTVTGIAKALLFQRGLGDALAAEREALEGLGRTHTDRLAEQKATFESLMAAIASEREEASASATEALTSQKAAFDARIQEAEEARDTTKKELEQLVEVFRKKISVHSSATYWRQRKWWHFGFAWAFGLVAAGVAAYGIRKLYLFAKLLFAPPPGSVAAVLPPVWQIATVVIMLSMLLWGVRILVRMSLAHAHRNLDAGERVVMVQTYLALAKEGHLTADEDRKLILAALFRHSPSGIVKDDAAPATPYDLFSRFIAGK